MIITIANAKGGVAKTTSAMYLAAAYGLRYEKEVHVLDADVQGSASLWADLAEQNGEDLGMVRVDAANASTLKRLRRTLDQETDDGLWIVDAPPQGPVLETAVKVADFVVVPTSPSPLDLQQAWATMSDIPEGKPAAVLVTRAERRTNAYRQTIIGLDEAGTPRFEEEHMISKRQELVNALGRKPSRLYEYPTVLDEIMQVMQEANA
ncbi:chromosome partitioning ATPase [Bifidobacterium saguini DSM 23967]|uniref:Chromosome partitioning ATPase n=3 Tax=Bifidobacterium saguini TaxID=762210 RepID=A0A087D245_9BIFI|nr:chromosome partitioning ATPase [Bifidobacterium saguini DSM 23967]QTB92096.1 ParA family protein [Bifidobacterium saguini]